MEDRTIKHGNFSFDVGIFKDSIKAFGKDYQSTVCMEECAELIQAISKLKRDPKESTTHLAEEMADVIICLFQLQEMYNVSDEEIQNWINFKTKRLMDTNYAKFMDNLDEMSKEEKNNPEKEIITNNKEAGFVMDLLKDLLGFTPTDDHKFDTLLDPNLLKGDNNGREEK